MRHPVVALPCRSCVLPLDPVLHYFREAAGQAPQPTYSINAFCWPISYLSESKLPAAVRVFEQTAKYSLRVTLLASVAYSGNKPVYTVTIQPNSSRESLCMMAREGSLPFARILLKTALWRGASVLRWWKRSGDCFLQHVAHSVFYVRPSCRGWP